MLDSCNNNVLSEAINLELVYKTIFKSAAKCISIFDLEGRLLLTNKSSEIFFGHLCNESTGLSLKDVTHPDFYEEAIKGFQDLINGNIEYWYNDQLILNKNGDYFWVRIVRTLVKDDNGRPLYILCLGEDITDLKNLETEITEHKNNLEKAVEEQTEQLSKAIDDLGYMNMKLIEAHQHKDRFLSTMSHELRTPLNAILGFSQSLEKQYFGKLNERQAEYIQLIQSSGQHLLNLINDILDLTKIDSGTMELNLEKTDTNSLISEISSLMMNQFNLKEIKLTKYVSDEAAAIYCDRQKIKQILFNLLGNALKYTDKGGKVELRVEKANGNIKFSVIDTGIGIKEEDLYKVFLEFHQLDPTYDLALGGTGIGLAVSKRLVELHGGIIIVESKFGEGSNFWFTIPAKAE